MVLMILSETDRQSKGLHRDVKDKLRSDDDYIRPSCKAALKPPKRGSGPLSVSFGWESKSVK